MTPAELVLGGLFLNLRDIGLFCGYGYPPNKFDWARAVWMPVPDGFKVPRYLVYSRDERIAQAENSSEIAYAVLTVRATADEQYKVVPYLARHSVSAITGPTFIIQISDAALVTSTLGGLHQLREELQPLAEQLADPWSG